MTPIIKMERVLLFLSLSLVTIGLFLSVIYRYILKLDFYGIEELVIIPTITLFFFGCAHADYQKRHVAADFVNSYITNEKVIKLIEIINYIIILVVCFILIYWNYENVLWSISKNPKTPGWEIPLFIPHTIVLIGFILMALHNVIHFVDSIKNYRLLKGED